MSNKWHDNKKQQKGHRGSPKVVSKRQRRGPGSLQVSGSTTLLIYGRHTVEAALGNPLRKLVEILGTENAFGTLSEALAAKTDFQKTKLSAAELSKLLGPDVVHQGIALRVKPLEVRQIQEVAVKLPDRGNLIVVLDQVTDPHNVGAVMRSAVAFGARAIITTDRHAPGESGALAKSASGALDILPWIRVPNLARALEQLKDFGYWRVGLDASATDQLADIDLGTDLAVILGAEGKGLRPLTLTHLDATVHIPIQNRIGSLNVSNAAAIALYELGKAAR